MAGNLIFNTKGNSVKSGHMHGFYLIIPVFRTYVRVLIKQEVTATKRIMTMK